MTARLHHTCGLSDAGDAFCWGLNTWSQLGDGTTTERNTPTSVATMDVFASLAAGASHTCGLVADGRVLSWGNNVNGQLGNGSTVASRVPVESIFVVN